MPASEQPDNNYSPPSLRFFSLMFVHINKCCFYSVLVVNSYICSLGSGDGNVTIFMNQNNCALGHWNFKLVMRLQVMR